MTVLTWEEYEELQWVWKQQWWHVEFVPEPTGRRPLGRQLGLHCSVEGRTDRETEVQSEDNKPPAGQGGITWLSAGRQPLFLLQGRGIEIWNKVIPEVFLLNLKSAQPDSDPQQSSFRGRRKLCRLQLAPGWSRRTTTELRATEKMLHGRTSETIREM